MPNANEKVNSQLTPVKFLFTLNSISLMRNIKYSVSLSFCVYAHTCLTLCNPWPIAHQGPLTIKFSRQEHYSGSPCPPPGDLPDPGIEPASPVSPALAGGFFTPEPPGKPPSCSSYQ